MLECVSINTCLRRAQKVSDERRVVDSTLSVDGFDCGGGGLHSGGDRPSGAHPGGGGGRQRRRQWRAQTPTSVLAANDGRRGLPTALRRGATTTTTMGHAMTRTAHAHRDDGTTRRDDDDEMRNARRARRQDETPNATRASESAARISGTDKSNNQLDDDGERGLGSGRKRPRQQQHGQAPAVDSD